MVVPQGRSLRAVCAPRGPAEGSMSAARGGSSAGKRIAGAGGGGGKRGRAGGGCGNSREGAEFDDFEEEGASGRRESTLRNKKQARTKDEVGKDAHGNEEGSARPGQQQSVFQHGDGGDGDDRRRSVVSTVPRAVSGDAARSSAGRDDGSNWLDSADSDADSDLGAGGSSSGQESEEKDGSDEADAGAWERVRYEVDVIAANDTVFKKTHLRPDCPLWTSFSYGEVQPGMVRFAREFRMV